MRQLPGMRTAGGVALVVLARSLMCTSAAHAEATPVSTTVQSSGASSVTEETTYTPPNRAIVGGGIIAFVGSYVPSVIVAAANGNAYDNRLYIPIAGPWLDLSNRPGCGSAQFDCSREAAFAGLLVVDGLVQGLGALAIALGFVVPERHTRVITASAGPAKKVALEKPSVHVVPARVSGDAYGVAAFGKF